MSRVMWPDSWEVRCKRPGRWVVEGYDVVQVRVDGRRVWQVTHGVDDEYRFVGECPLLDDAIRLIEDDVHDVVGE